MERRNIMLKDIKEEEYVFANEDYETFSEEYKNNTSVELNKRRKQVQMKLLDIHKELYTIIQNKGYKIYKHYSDSNITSLPYCTPYANNNEVHWLGIRYGQDSRIVKEIDRDRDKSSKDPFYGFLMYQCFQVNIRYSGVEIGIFHSISRNSYDRGYVHDNIDNKQFQQKLIEVLKKLKGYGIKWYAGEGVFEFDTQDVTDFIDFYKHYDEYNTYSICSITIPRWSRLLLKENMVQTCVDYIDLLYELFETIRWKIG